MMRPALGAGRGKRRALSFWHIEQETKDYFALATMFYGMTDDTESQIPKYKLFLASRKLIVT